MAKSPGGQESQAKSDQQNSPKEPEKFPAGKRISRVSLVLFFAALFTLLAGWAGLLGNLGHTFWILAASIMWAASLFLAVSVGLELRNHHWDKWQYNGAACAVAIVASAIAIPVIVREVRHNEPRPHLKLALSKMSGIVAETELELTNDFLMFSERNIPSSNAHGVLVVPVN